MPYKEITATKIKITTEIALARPKFWVSAPKAILNV
jgi:hypothetical protein